MQNLKQFKITLHSGTGARGKKKPCAGERKGEKKRKVAGQCQSVERTGR